MDHSNLGILIKINYNLERIADAIENISERNNYDY